MIPQWIACIIIILIGLLYIAIAKHFARHEEQESDKKENNESKEVTQTTTPSTTTPSTTTPPSETPTESEYVTEDKGERQTET